MVMGGVDGMCVCVCVCVCRGGGPGSRRERTMIPLLLGWGKSLDRKKEPQCIARIW